MRENDFIVKARSFIENDIAFQAILEARTAYVAYLKTLNMLKEKGKTEFNVILTSYDEAKKITVIKEVRTITGLGLKEAKELVEGTPKILKGGVSKDEATEIDKIVSKAGGTVILE